MIWGDQPLRTAFLLGAGATRGAFRHAVINRKRVPAPLNGDFFERAKTYVRAVPKEKARLEQIERVFQSEFRLTDTERSWARRQPTMEEAFSLLYVTKDFPSIYRRGPGPKRKRGHRPEIESFLDLTAAMLSDIETHLRAETLYDRLAASLQDSDAVLTLNYDTLLDSALLQRGWDPSRGYRLGGSPSKYKWQRQKNVAPLNVNLLKLHGSTNWFVNGTYEDFSKVFTSKPSVITAPRRNGINRKIRQIVPPIYGKTFGHDCWESIWKVAFDELVTCEVLVVVGCSLIDSDFHLTGFLNRVRETRRAESNLFRRLVLVDRNLAIRRKWKAFLKGSYRECASIKGFAKFANASLKEST